MKTTFSRISTTAGLLVVAAGLCAVLNAQAGKPSGGSTSPAYQYINLGTLGLPDGNAKAINAFGMVVGTLVDASNKWSAFVVVPKDVNQDGQPDLWFEDADGNDLNDLQQPLGKPVGIAGLSFGSMEAVDINDYGQILLAVSSSAGKKIYVLTPQDVDGDGAVEFFSAAADGGNALMAPVPLDGIFAQITPSSINNLGQITGSETGTLRNPDGSIRTPIGFVLTGKDTDEDGMAETWFEDAGLGLNRLVQSLGYTRGQYGELTTVMPAKINDRGEIAGRVPRGDGDWGNACLIRPRLTESGPAWNVDANGDGLNDLVVKLLPVQSSAWGQASGISETGNLTGWGTLNKASSSFAALWQVSPSGAVTTTKLPKVGGEDWHDSRAINSQNVIVGRTVTYGPGISVRSQCAFVYQNGTTKDLRTLTDQAAALQGAAMGATDINEAGEIVGWTDSAAGSHPFIAVPIKK